MTSTLGIDLGTSSVKVMVVDSDGTVRGTAAEAYPILVPKEDFAEQDPETWWRCTVLAVRKAIAASGVRRDQIAAVGLSGQMHGGVLVDEKGSVIRPAIIWADQRTTEEVEEIYRRVGRQRMGEITLNPVYTGVMLSSLLWIRKHEPESYKRANVFVLPKDYIRFRLSGELCSDKTDASSTLAFDTPHEQWSDEIIEALQLRRSLFPEAHDPTRIVGAVSTDAAEETGLRGGMPVIAGASDQAMQAIGNGVIEPGSACLTIGTGGQLFAVTKSPVFNPKMNTHTFCNVVPDTWYTMAATLSAGLSLSWLKNNILRDTDFDEMTHIASSVPAGSDGLYFLPYLIGERSPHLNPHARGMFFGLRLSHERAHMVRSVMEGVVYSMKDCLSLFDEIKIPTERVIASGGAAKSSVWRQIQSDVLDREIVTAQIEEQACFGAAISAAVGIGVFSSFGQACGQMVRFNKEVTTPDAKSRSAYQERYEIYKQLYPQTRDLMK